jgi:hypothetical protein
LAEVVAYGPVLDCLDAPNVDLLGGELLAGGLLAEELAEVAAVHRHFRDHLVAFCDLVLDLAVHRAPQAV